MMHPGNCSSRFLLREEQGVGKDGSQGPFGRGMGRVGEEAGWVVRDPSASPQEYELETCTSGEGCGPRAGQLWEKGGAFLRDVSLNGQL